MHFRTSKSPFGTVLLSTVLGAVAACSQGESGTDDVTSATGGTFSPASGGATGGNSADPGGTASGGTASGGANSGGQSTGGGAPADGGAGGTGATGGVSTGGSGNPAGSGGQDDGPPAAPEGSVPNQAYPDDLIDLPRDRWADGLVSPTLEAEHHNQPAIINGYLQLTGNARFSIYDISDPSQPDQLSVAVSPDDCGQCGPKAEGEAEGHQVSFAKYGDKFYTVTISGKGIDIWDITNVRMPVHLSSVHLEGVDFGDFTEAVWGVAWQGTNIFVGGTNTGLHVVEVSDPSNPQVIKRLPTSALGNVSAGPVFAVGNVLVVTTPKESGGIATLDISDPHSPMILDAMSTNANYMGAFYGHHAYMQSPVRAWDVLTDPTNIGQAVDSLDTPSSEYMSFSDGYMFLGLLRPDPGALKIDVTDPSNLRTTSRIWGRMNLSGNDDQFTVAVGNLLVMSDDQLQENGNGYVGTVIGVHAAEPDTVPPRVDTVIPKDGATGQALESRVGVSFTDNIELATVDSRSFIVRPLGGAALKGRYSVTQTVLTFDPDEELMPDTTYEVVLPAGGVKDYVGNAIAGEFVSTFVTR